MNDRRNRFVHPLPGSQPDGARNDGDVHNLARAKSALRTILREQLKGVQAGQRARASAEACQRLSEQGIWRRASSILGYAPMADELDISWLIESALKAGKVVALPQFDPQSGAYRACRITRPISEVSVGRFGIREPGTHCPSMPLCQLDLILVPGLGFDLSGRRLGRGRGFYDQLLAGIRGIKCGSAFDEQVKAEIPVETHDVLLDCLLTPTRWLEFRQWRLGNDLVG